MHGNGRYTPEKDLDLQLHTWLLDEEWSLLPTGYHVKQNHLSAGWTLVSCPEPKTDNLTPKVIIRNG